MKKINRLISPYSESFFLLGPRGTGKSTWLKDCYWDATVVDLLKPDVFRTLQSRPESLSDIVKGNAQAKCFVIDEVQKVPEVLSMVSNGTTRAEAVCHKYYEQTEAKSSDPAVRITWWACPDGSRLLFLANATPRDVTSSIDVSAFGRVMAAREEWVGGEVPVADGRFEMLLPSRSFRIVRLAAKIGTVVRALETKGE